MAGKTVEMRMLAHEHSPSLPRIALVGTGGFGRHHLAALQALDGLDECRLVALCDNGNDAVQNMEDSRSKAIVRHASIHSLLDVEHLDHVVLSTPPHLHREQACAVLDRGLSLYLEKPPVTTIEDFSALLGVSRRSVTVGFQLLEAPRMQAFKREILNVGRESIRRLSVAGLWPRTTWYYKRSPWAGRMTCDGRAVFDGPLTNAFAHLVHSTFYLLGPAPDAFAVPFEVRARLLRARPIEGYDFGRIEGTTTDGIPFEIVAAHCAKEAIPWRFTVEMTSGRRIHLRESEIPSPAHDLLIACHRGAFSARRGDSLARASLENCAGYVGATCAALRSSAGIQDVPHDVSIEGAENDEIYHSQRLLDFVRETVAAGRSPSGVPGWLRPGSFVRCPVLRSAPDPLLTSANCRTGD